MPTIAFVRLGSLSKVQSKINLQVADKVAHKFQQVCDDHEYQDYPYVRRTWILDFLNVPAQFVKHHLVVDRVEVEKGHGDIGQKRYHYDHNENRILADIMGEQELEFDVENTVDG